MNDQELYHFGVKGMKWGVRKERRKNERALRKEYGKLEDQMTYGKNADKKKNAAVSKKIASVEKQMNDPNSHNKNYTDKQRKNDRAFYGNRGEKRINKKMNKGYGLRGARHFEAERKARNEKAARGAKKASKVLGRIALYSITDDIFYGGAGKRAVKNAVKTAGRVVISAYTRARGGYDIHWYDN